MSNHHSMAFLPSSGIFTFEHFFLVTSSTLSLLPTKSLVCAWHYISASLKPQSQTFLTGILRTSAHRQHRASPCESVFAFMHIHLRGMSLCLNARTREQNTPFMSVHFLCVCVCLRLCVIMGCVHQHTEHEPSVSGRRHT